MMTTEQPEGLTRGKIIQTASEMFLRDGYANTSIQAIADAVGIAKATFYHHFKGKEDVLIAMADRIAHRIMVAANRDLLRTDLDPRQKLVALYKHSADVKIESMREGIVLAKQVQNDANLKLMRHIERATRRFVTPLMADLIAQGVRAGLFNVSHPEEAAELIVGIPLSLRDKAIELFTAALDGDENAIKKSMSFLAACEEAVERILGVEHGMLGIYQIDVLEGVLRRGSQ